MYKYEYPIKITYDNKGRVVSIYDKDRYDTSIVYTDGGLISDIIYNNTSGECVKYLYDKSNRIAYSQSRTINQTRGSMTVESHRYVYDDNGDLEIESVTTESCYLQTKDTFDATTVIKTYSNGLVIHEKYVDNIDKEETNYSHLYDINGNCVYTKVSEDNSIEEYWYSYDSQGNRRAIKQCTTVIYE